MKRYIVLDRTGRGGPTRDALILRDGFGWRRFLFPWAWLMARGLWLTGAVVLGLQIGLLMLGTPFDIAAILIGLLVALEGPVLVAMVKRRRGFEEVAVHYGERRSDIERIYFADAVVPATPEHAAPLAVLAPAAPPQPIFAGWRSGRSLLATGAMR